MKKLFLIVILSFAIGWLYAQNATDDAKVEVTKCSKFKISKPLRELIAAHPFIPSDEKVEMKDRENRVPYRAKVNLNAFPVGEDLACQKTMGTKMLLAPIVSWNGQNSSSYPPDPSGAAGPNNYMQSINTQYRVYTKTGGVVSGGGPFNLGTLLFGSNEGDALVLYDKFAGRWVVTEFGTSNVYYVGVSQTSDPLGAYYTYQFTASNFPDYLKFSIWTDGYYMSANTNPKRIYVLERDQMLLGNANSRSINKSFAPAGDGGFACPLPGDADGQLPPLGTPCPIFSYEDDGWGTGYVDRINIYNMAVTWGTTPAATLTLAAQLPTTPFDASYSSSWDDIAQPGSTQKLDGIGGVFTFRAQYRVWTGYHSVVLNNGVLVNSTTGQRSIRWYELRKDVASGTWSIYQQSTYAPDLLNRWVGSIAMDDFGSIGMAYAVSGTDGTTNVYPSIRYTGRLATDPLNTMTATELVGAAGTSVQSGINRFGDYSHTCLDPNDGTIFWHTGEFVSGGNPVTKIFSFRISHTGNWINEVANPAQLNVYLANGNIEVKATNLPSSDMLVVDLFDITGKKIEGKTIMPNANTVETSFVSNTLAKGAYLVRIGNNNTYFQKVTKIIVE
ncbi:MAG: T9SS type A sorting domain-containing protein [Bacteroidota bacterium]